MNLISFEDLKIIIKVKGRTTEFIGANTIAVQAGKSFGYFDKNKVEIYIILVGIHEAKFKTCIVVISIINVLVIFDFTFTVFIALFFISK